MAIVKFYKDSFDILGLQNAQNAFGHLKALISPNIYFVKEHLTKWHCPLLKSSTENDHAC